MAGSRSTLNTGLPLNSQVNLLMILRGMTLPSWSLRRPVSIGCAIRVLISITSPFLASVGSLMRGFSAIVLLLDSRRRSAAAAADGDLDRLHLREHLAFAGLRHHDDVLRDRKPDAGRDQGAARHRRQMKGGEARARVAFCHHEDIGHVVVGSHRALD